MEVKSRYKQTEVGMLPTEWEVVPLSQIANLDVGYSFKSSWFRKS